MMKARINPSGGGGFIKDEAPSLRTILTRGAEGVNGKIERQGTGRMSSRNTTRPRHASRASTNASAEPSAAATRFMSRPKSFSILVLRNAPHGESLTCLGRGNNANSAGTAITTIIHPHITTVGSASGQRLDSGGCKPDPADQSWMGTINHL